MRWPFQTFMSFVVDVLQSVIRFTEDALNSCPVIFADSPNVEAASGK